VRQRCDCHAQDDPDVNLMSVTDPAVPVALARMSTTGTLRDRDHLRASADDMAMSSAGYGTCFIEQRDELLVCSDTSTPHH
jgi:hypothetical protein